MLFRCLSSMSRLPRNATPSVTKIVLMGSDVSRESLAGSNDFGHFEANPQVVWCPPPRVASIRTPMTLPCKYQVVWVSHATRWADSITFRAGACSPRASLQQMLADHHALHLIGAFVDLGEVGDSSAQPNMSMPCELSSMYSLLSAQVSCICRDEVGVKLSIFT